MGSLAGKETMLTSSAGATSKLRQRGITLLEMLIVVSLIGLLAGLSYPSVTAGLDTLRLRSASDVVVTLLSTALDRAERRQAVVEVQILPADNALLARTADLAFNKRVDLPQGRRWQVGGCQAHGQKVLSQARPLAPAAERGGSA